MNGNYIIEFNQVGKFIKVCAIDQKTLTEVSIVVPAGKGLSKNDMTKLAVKRLEYVLNKKEKC